MKLKASLIKSLKENMREWKVLVLSLSFAPIFVLLMYAGYGGSATSYKMHIVDLDNGIHSQSMISSFEDMTSTDDSDFFIVSIVDDIEKMKQDIREKTIDIGLVIPAGYSDDLEKGKETYLAPQIEFFGSLGNAKYAVSAIVAGNSVYEVGMDVQQIMSPVYFEEIFLEKKQPLNEFEAMVPGLLSLGILMILFTCTASIVKENDQMTITRLKLSSIGAANYLGGESIIQAMIGSAAVLIAYLSTKTVGYNAQGSLLLIMLVAVISSLSMVAVSLIMASFLNSVFDVLTIGVLPFFVIMFFSGAMFPLPKLTFVSIAGLELGLPDLIPLTHTVRAIDKIMNFDAGLEGLSVELSMLVILTFAYLIIGIIFYQRKQLSKA